MEKLYHVQAWQEARKLCKEVGLSTGIHCQEEQQLKQYVCEYCGIYKAIKPKCNKCECED